MSPLPTDWPRISSSLFYDEPAKAIDWLCGAFGFSVRLKVEGADGGIEHSELELGSGLIMVSSSRKSPRFRSPRSLDQANTQCLFAYVEDIEAHCARARAAGAKILSELKISDYGAEYW